MVIAKEKVRILRHSENRKAYRLELFCTVDVEDKDTEYVLAAAAAIECGQ